ncbi:ABC transporter ATP-binding protein [Paenibacillus lautus]|uniref:ABC transporter ATP-binding protein n=1 Tax=Paenibacillus lautus TaxID=1401 RepID=UPI00203D3E08|nr:ABC transporter ATP-binding protein [Paenibacillus lautus]MCM3261596.1 ABC transporter ATP-binding protein [Paenibacillus lautus]
MNAISIRNLSKSFKLYHDKPTTLKERALFLKRKTYTELKILENINIDIKKGEMIGLIGHNGSGKSTLLKLLTQIIYPDSGEIEIKGRVSSLLELGAGFHPDFTGIENIYMNASIFGLTKADIDEKKEDIIAFSELGEFIHNPVRTYSSGMYMRLAFAVAINIEPDILLVDEVLAVGDASFQRKCLNRIKQLKSANKTIVLVTHDHAIVERMCDRAIWLHQGKVREDGHPKDVVNSYLAYLANKDREIELQQQEAVNESETKANETAINNVEEEKRWGNKDVEITSVKIINKSESEIFVTEEPATIEIQYVNHINTKSAIFGFAIHTIDKIRVYGTNTQLEPLDDELPKTGTLVVEFPEFNLVEGDYIIDVAVHDDTGLMFDYRMDILRIRVVSTVHDVGVCRIPHSWSIKSGG